MPLFCLRVLIIQFPARKQLRGPDGIIRNGTPSSGWKVPRISNSAPSSRFSSDVASSQNFHGSSDGCLRFSSIVFRPFRPVGNTYGQIKQQGRKARQKLNGALQASYQGTSLPSLPPPFSGIHAACYTSQNQIVQDESSPHIPCDSQPVYPSYPTGLRRYPP